MVLVIMIVAGDLKVGSTAGTCLVYLVDFQSIETSLHFSRFQTLLQPVIQRSILFIFALHREERRTMGSSPCL